MKTTQLIKVLITGFLLAQFNYAIAQSICLDSILINGSITKFMKYSDFIDTGIKIDSIIKPTPGTYSDEPDSVIYVGSSEFYYYSESKRCDAASIWFDKIEYVQLGKYKVNASTTGNDLKMMFPAGCGETKPIKHYSFRGTILETCSLNVIDSEGRMWDMRILFFLKDDKLIGFDFWEPV